VEESNWKKGAPLEFHVQKIFSLERRTPSLNLPCLMLCILLDVHGGEAWQPADLKHAIAEVQRRKVPVEYF